MIEQIDVVERMDDMFCFSGLRKREPMKHALTNARAGGYPVNGQLPPKIYPSVQPAVEKLELHEMLCARPHKTALGSWGSEGNRSTDRKP
jgi:hypothetical protein